MKRLLRTCIPAFLVLGVIGCEEDTVFITGGADNEPPIVVTQGPDFPTGPVEGTGPTIWVLAGDPDGLEDISAVFLTIETLRVYDMIVRPDADDGGCAGPLYEPGNVIDTSSSFALPLEFGGPSDLQMGRQEGGVYAINPFTIPDLDVFIDAFGSPSGCASGPPSWLDWYYLLPPAAPAPTSIFLTFIDLEFIGVSVTIYDAAGESATTTFPNLRMNRTTTEETATAP
jgi:hypothetical protein